MVLSITTVGVLVMATATAALPASLAMAGPEFKISADRMEATGFVQFPHLDQVIDKSSVPVVMTGLKSARINSLCQSVLVPTPLGSMTLRITAGADTPVMAENLVINLTELNGDITFTDLRLGVDASTVGQVGGTTGSPGGYAQLAGTVVIDRLRATARTTTAGTFRLQGLRLALEPGRRECF